MPMICQAIIDGKVCGHSNPDGLDFCDNCGSDLRNQTVVDTNVIDVEVVEVERRVKLPTPPLPALSPPPQIPDAPILPQGVPKAAGSATLSPVSIPNNGALTNGHTQLVVLRNRPVGKTYPLDSPEIHMGRWDADNGHFPEIGLTNDDLDSKISRSHAKITFENGQYFVEDLGSLNGTFINRGTRLVQGQKAPLSHSDELIMGKMFFRFEVGGMASFNSSSFLSLCCVTL